MLAAPAAAAADEDFTGIFAQLGGVWQLMREMSGGANFTGQAEFRACGRDEWLVHEKGALALANGNRLEAERSWLWRLEGRALLAILFADHGREGTLYHRLHLARQAGRWNAEGTHACGPDVYQAQYQFAPASIRIDQRIAGPRKKLAITSRFTREPLPLAIDSSGK